MRPSPRLIQLHGRTIITGTIKAVTGLRIGGRPTGIEIGGIDNIVLRNPLTNQPYIPGSSLRGKMRCLYERFSGVVLNYSIDEERVQIHSCSKPGGTYPNCRVCRIFGLPAPGAGEGETRAKHPTPLVVRDIDLTEDSVKDLQGRADNYTEIKWEASIDRITSAAVPRQMERVPAGAKFGPFELVYSLYLRQNLTDLPEVFASMRLLEDDYLGGLGSRGSGKIRFESIEVTCMGNDHGRYVRRGDARPYDDVAQVLRDEGAGLTKWIEETIPIPEEQEG